MMELIYGLLAGLTFCPILFFYPLCPGCRGCNVVNDGFASDTLADYTAVAGTWTHSSGSICSMTGYIKTSSANAVLVHDSSVGTSGGAVEVVVCFSAYATKIRLIGGYVDSDNYIIGEVECIDALTARLRLFERVGGVETSIYSFNTVSSITSNSPETISLVWNGTHACLKVGPSSQSSSQAFGETSLSGTQGGVGTADNAGEVRFGNFQLQYHADDRAGCYVCLCALGCIERTQQLQMQYDVTGLTNNSCSNCASLNATYICDAALCNYPQTISGACGLTQITTNTSVNSFEMQLTGGPIRWIVLPTQPYDCSVPRTLSLHSNVSGVCNGVGSQVLATPL